MAYSTESKKVFFQLLMIEEIYEVLLNQEYEIDLHVITTIKKCIDGMHQSIFPFETLNKMEHLSSYINKLPDLNIVLYDAVVLDNIVEHICNLYGVGGIDHNKIKQVFERRLKGD